MAHDVFISHSSNNSEQVLREVQLAANSHLHIVQFRIDAVTPSDDLEYYLSGPHWLDAVTPPLENHLEQLKNSRKALLALSGTEVTGRAMTAEAPRPVAPAIAPPSIPPSIAAKPATNIWKWMALAAVAVALLGGVLLLVVFGFQRSNPPPTVAATAPIITPLAQTVSAVQPNVSAEPSRSTPSAIAAPPANTSTVVSMAEAERYAKAFYRELERGDLNKAVSYLDETVDYYSLGPKDKAFITEQTRQFLAAIPVRTFVVGDVTVQDSSRPMTATVIFDVRYSARDVLGNPGSGRTRVEWDVAKRGDSLKIVRSNWMTYPDPSPSR